MPRSYLPLLLVLLMTSALPLWAQPAPPGDSMPGMDHFQPTAIIDGKDHPELIPDLTAYRLFFIAVGETPNPTEERKARQRAFIHKMGNVGDVDEQAIVQTLADFKVRFNAMVSEFNKRVENAVKSGASLPDTDEFLKQRDQLVQQTRDKLQLETSPDGMANLDAHVQREKRRMQIAAKGTQ